MSGQSYKAFYVVDATAVRARVFIQGTLTEVKGSVQVTCTNLYQRIFDVANTIYFLAKRVTLMRKSTVLMCESMAGAYPSTWPVQTLAYLAFSLMSKETKISKKVFS
jgi:hypothetical protein